MTEKTNPRLELSPEESQIQLISVFKSIPQFEAINHQFHTPSDPNYFSLEEQNRSEALIRAISRRTDSLIQSELINLKRNQLQSLLDKAVITETAKFIINEEFETAFMFGYQDIFPVFDHIGVTENNRMEAGIFSKNPETRKTIERKLHDQLCSDYWRAVDDYKIGKSPDNLEIIKNIANLLTDLGIDFEMFYNETITNNSGIPSD